MKVAFMSGVLALMLLSISPLVPDWQPWLLWVTCFFTGYSTGVLFGEAFL